MKVKTACVFLLLLASPAAYADSTEAWYCKDYVSPDDVIVKATISKDRTAGEIRVAGTTQTTLYRVAGFSRRWDFGRLDDGTYQYAFIIEPNGDGKYFDYSSGKEAKPSLLMKCKLE